LVQEYRHNYLVELSSTWIESMRAKRKRSDPLRTGKEKGETAKREKQGPETQEQQEILL
jgi:hypothetical protein